MGAYVAAGAVGITVIQAYANHCERLLEEKRREAEIKIDNSWKRLYEHLEHLKMEYEIRGRHPL